MLFKKPILILSLLGCLTSGAYALDIVPSNSNYYYQLGGGSDVSMPPVTTQQDITIGGDINTSLRFTCDGFNPAVTLSDTLNNIQSSLQGMQQSVINSATAAVGSMPMYLLAKSNKSLYNLLQNTMTGAQDIFNVSMASCQDDLNQIKNGKSPIQNWFRI